MVYLESLADVEVFVVKEGWHMCYWGLHQLGQKCCLTCGVRED